MEFLDQPTWNDIVSPIMQGHFTSLVDLTFDPPYYNWGMPMQQPLDDIGLWPAYQYSYGIEEQQTIDPSDIMNPTWFDTGSNEQEHSETVDQPSAPNTAEGATPPSNRESEEIDVSDTSSLSSSDADSDYIPSSADSPAPDVGNTNTKRRYHPYRVQARDRRVGNRRGREPDSTEEDTGSCTPPTTAAYCDSSPKVIKQQLDLLLHHLRENGLSSTPHNPRLLCPVIDCPLGGWNILLHGPNLAVSRRKKGNFLSANEVARHVTSLHAPDTELVCLHPDCKEQERLNQRTERGGFGYFCRVDVFRRHLKKYPEHRKYIPEELRARRKLFPRETE
ncbi:hypothetical protein FRC19_004358 [Serendipita sp. 401]|nr:hypothetical protein FRC19_004358 [Serendipita sp. 401]